MRYRLVWVLIAWALWPRLASAADTPPVLIQAPSRADILNAYPTTARLQGVSGEAVLRCTVTTAGALDPCGILSQEPTWTPFGEVALRLAHLYRYRPATHDGRPVETALDVPVEFTAPPPDPAGARKTSAGAYVLWRFGSFLVTVIVVGLMFRSRRSQTAKQKPFDLAGD